MCPHYVCLLVPDIQLVLNKCVECLPVNNECMVFCVFKFVWYHTISGIMHILLFI